MNANFFLRTLLFTLLIVTSSCNVRDARVNDSAVLCNQKINLELPKTSEFLDLKFIEVDTILARAWVKDADPQKALKIISWRVNLKTGQFSEVALIQVPLMRDPCKGQCETTVIEQSPDKQWQVVLGDGKVEPSGLWLVGQTQQLELAKPDFGGRWMWAKDSSMLWFSQKSRYGTGLLGQLIYLQPNLRTQEFPTELIGAADSQVVFLPDQKIVSSVSKQRLLPGSNKVLTPEQTLESLNLVSGIVTITKAEVIPGLGKISWDEGRQSLLLTKLSAEGVNISLVDGKILARVPRSAFEYKYFSTEALLFGDSEIGKSLSLSADRKYIAWIDDSNIDAYQCIQP